MIFQGFPVVISLVMVFGSFLMVSKVSNFMGNGPGRRACGYLANAARVSAFVSGYGAGSSGNGPPAAGLPQQPWN